MPGPALDISNAGVVGNYLNGTKSLGFIYENGSYVSIDIPGSTQVVAEDINNSGQVVGYEWDGIRPSQLPDQAARQLPDVRALAKLGVLHEPIQSIGPGPKRKKEEPLDDD